MWHSFDAWQEALIFVKNFSTTMTEQHTEQGLHPVYARPVVEFVAVANQYCQFVEQLEAYSKQDALDKLHKVMAFLYQRAVLLPEIEPEVEGGTEHIVTEEDYESLEAMLAMKLGTHEQFLEVYEPVMQESKDAVQVGLAEAIADIYQDLKNFVTAYGQGVQELMTVALHACRVNFGNYWGPRLLAAEAALHNLLFGREELEDEDQANQPKKYESAEKLDTGNWLINNLFENKENHEE